MNKVRIFLFLFGSGSKPIRFNVKEIALMLFYPVHTMLKNEIKIVLSNYMSNFLNACFDMYQIILAIC